MRDIAAKPFRVHVTWLANRRRWDGDSWAAEALNGTVTTPTASTDVVPVTVTPSGKAVRSTASRGSGTPAVIARRAASGSAAALGR